MRLQDFGFFLMTSLGCAVLLPAWAEEPENDTDPENTAGPAAETAAPPPPPKNPPLPLDLQRGKLLAEEFSRDNEKKASIHWFREGQKQAFLGLYTENYGREPQGYMLILHDNQQHPDWPGLVRQLRTQLPPKGWSTLAISLPVDWRLTDPPPREKDTVIVKPAEAEASDTKADKAANDTTEESSEKAPEKNAGKAAKNAGSPASAQPQLTYTQLSVAYPSNEIPNIIQGRIGEALQFLQARDPMPIVLVAIGTSATYAAKQVHNLRMRDIAGLVIVDPKDVEQEGFDVNSDAPGLRIPVLDLVPEFHPRSDPAARLRRARQESREVYEQQVISGADPEFTGYEDFVTKAIRGWAKRVIIDKKRFGYL
ncbi:MAG: DUF3530 family protein [Ketobacteraceae bacterium]|nr:DUF3530 family protein [Ketobacteraceae bacterium]